MFDYFLNFLILIVVLASGCSSKLSRPKVEFIHEYTAENMPEFWVEYYPYSKSQQLETIPVARAVPSIEAWTDLRMHRDLQRINQAGIKVILLCISPENLASEYFAERMNKFQKLISENNYNLSFAINLSPEKENFTLSLPNTMEFFKRQKLSSLQNYLHINGQKALFFSENVKLLDRNNVPGFYALIKEYFPEIQDENLNAKRVKIRAAAKPFVNKAKSEELDLRLATYRQRGKIFSENLQNAFAGKAQVILLSSWNNYEELSFIENNSFDEDLMLYILKQAR